MKTTPSTPTVRFPKFRHIVTALFLTGFPACAWSGIILNDQFADGERVTQVLPDSARWYLDSSSGAYSSSVSGSTWTIQPPPPPSHIGAMSYFTSGSPVELEPGDSLEFSFVLEPGNGSARLAFGLFNSGGSRLAADISGGSRKVTDYEGFAGDYSPADNSLSLSGRSKSGKELWTPSAFRKIASAPDVVSPSLSGRATLTVTRSEKNEIALRLNIAGKECMASVSRGVTRFDTVAIFLDGRMGQSRLGQITLTKTSATSAEPASGKGALAGQASALRALPPGAMWYLQTSQTSSAQNWNTLTTWYSATSGGTNPGAISATESFNLNGFRVYSPLITTGTTTFGGGAMLVGPSGTVALVGSNSTTTAIPYLVSTGGIITNAGGSIQNLRITEFEPSQGNLVISTGASNRTVFVLSSTLTGSGTVTFGGAGKHQLIVTNGYNFSGALNLSTGTMTFQNNLATSGPLVIAQTYKVNLTQAISCASLTLTGTSISPAPGEKPGSYTFPPGTYSYAALNAAYPNIFVSGTTGGSITVRSGTAYYLKTNQALGRSWSTAYSSDWNSLPSGGGTNAPAVNPLDDYSTNGRLVRSPATANTFTGRNLLLQNGSLGLKNPRPEVATVPSMIATSGTIMQYLNTSGTTSLRVNYYTQNSGTTTLLAIAGQTLDLGIDYLSGNGNFLFASAGESLFTVTDASQFSGTYTQASGTLRLSPITSGPVFAVGSPFAMKGRLVVNSGATVALNRDAYVGGLTVNGTARANGTYTAATLGFSGSARIVVNTPDLTGPTSLFGVNIACGTFAAGGALMPTTASYWTYYQGKGLTLIRVPFLWEHVQPTLNGALNASMLGKFDTILSLANARGMKVILDMHNYGRFNGQAIGSAAVPVSAYQDVWTRLSAHFSAHPNKAALYGYDIMNEPVHLSTNWPQIAKAAIAGVRANDMTTYIVAEGKYYAGAQSWNSQNGNLGFIDPACRLIYSAHSYWGTNHNDIYLSYDAEKGYPNMAVDQLRLFVDWIKKRKFAGFVGEYGVPTNVASPDARWHIVLDRALNYLRINNVSGTYWSGGPGWQSDYQLLSDVFLPPSSSVDAPAMSVVEDYHQ